MRDYQKWAKAAKSEAPQNPSTVEGPSFGVSIVRVYLHGSLQPFVG